jgi:uncharacterized protein (TIGR02270 family)
MSVVDHKRAVPAESDSILWDVLQEHLDEATFGLEQFERALNHPLRTLSQLERYPERRLFAHLDGLVLGGPRVWNQLLRPVLRGEESPEPARVCVAAMTFLRAGELEPVWAALGHEDPAVRQAVVRAGQLAGTAALDRELVQRFQSETTPSLCAALLDLIGLRSLTPPATLVQATQASDDSLVAAAARVCVKEGSRHQLSTIERLLHHASGDVRAASLVGALALGSQAAWQQCQRVAVETADPLWELATVLTAQLGGRAHHRALLERLQDKKTRKPVLFALGYSGDTAVLGTLVEHLSSEDRSESKCAAQAIATISGIDLGADEFVDAAPPGAENPDESLPALEDDDPNADLVPAYEEALPLPNVATITASTRALLARTNPAVRVLQGAPFSLTCLLDGLESAPLNRRHVLGIWLTIHSGATLQLDTRQFSETQRAALTRLRERALTRAGRVELAPW